MRWTCKYSFSISLLGFSCAVDLSSVAYLVVRLDVQLDLFAGEGADPVGGLVSLLRFGFG